MPGNQKCDIGCVCRKYSLEVRKLASDGALKQYANMTEEQRVNRGQKIGEALESRFKDKTKNPAYGKHQSENTRQKIGAKVRAARADHNWDPWNKGLTKKDHPEVQILSDNMVARWRDPVASRKLIIALRSPETSQKMRISQGKRVSHSWRRGPNKLEKRFMELTGLPFVGDGTVIIGGRWPDFVIREKRKVVEVYGCYWHDCPMCNEDSQFVIPDPRVEHFKSYGYDCLVVWEHEVYQEPRLVKQRIEEYVA